MSLPPRRARRIDGNQRQIIDAVRRAGAVVYDSSGEGCDLWVGVSGCGWEPWEIKDGSLPPSRRTLTKSEAQMQLVCRVDHLPYEVILNVDQALARIAELRSRGRG